ncbi:hypothetical protein ATCC90586_007089 [Pythium insidiosum]|nr:hypothetical protein ATCC90586_007089 [Pythium insidiosum]
MAMEVSPVGPDDAAAVTSRVQLVADKLLQKAQEAQARGNATAAQSLSESVADLRRAATLLQELHRRVASSAPSAPPTPSSSPPVSSNGPSSQPPSRSTSVKDLLTKLGRVEVMLGKKSDEMRQKGNEAAAQALQQAAWTVRQGAQHVTEQQQLTRALVGTARGLREELHALCELLLGGDNAGDSDAPKTAMAMERAREMVAVWETVKTSYPTCGTVDELRAAIVEAVASNRDQSDAASSKQVDELTIECERLRRALHDADAQREALESEWSQRWNAVNEDLSVTKASLSRREEEHDAVIAALQAECETLREQAEAASDAERVANVQAQLEEERRASMERQDVWAREQQELVSKVQRAETEKEELDQELTRLRGEHQRLLDQVEDRDSSGQDQVSALLREIEALNGKQTELQRRLEETESSRDTAINDLEATAHSLEEMESMVLAMKKALKDREVEAEDLKSEKSRLEEDLSSTREALAAASTAAQQSLVASSAALDRIKVLFKPLQSDDFLWEELQGRLSSALEASPSGPSQEEEKDVVATLNRVVKRAISDIAHVKVSIVQDQEAAISRLLSIIAADESSSKTIGDLERELSGFAEKKSALEEERSSLQERVEKLQNDLSAIDVSHKEALRVATEAADSTIALLREELKTASEKIATLSQEIEGHQAERQASTASSERDVEKLRKQLNDIESEFERYRARSHTALKKVEKRAELLNGMRKENEELKAAVDELRSRQDTTVQQEQVWRSRIDELTNALAMCEEEIEQRDVNVTAQLAQLTAEHDTAVNELKERSNLIEQLRKDNADLCSRIEGVQKAAQAERTAALEQSEQVIVGLRDNLASVRSELTEAQTRLEALEASLQETTEAAEAKEVEWAARVATVEARLLARDDETAAAKDQELSATLDENKRLAEEKQQLEAAAADHETSMQQLSRRVKELEALHAAATVEIEELRQQATGTESSVAEVAEGTTPEHSEQLEKEREADRATIEKLQQDLSTARRRVEELSQVQISREDLAARDEIIKSLRKQLLDLEEEHAESQVREDGEALQQAQAERQQKMEQHVQAAAVARRRAAVAAFEQRASSVVEELQHRLEEYSVVFRDACALEEEGVLNGSSDRQGQEEGSDGEKGENDGAFEEYLVFKSGVVIKAGASFSLPVVCEREGLRVVWKFTVKEDGADVAFSLSAGSPRELIVPKERVNELSGVYNATAPGTSLLFEWDNSFSWLNEKTLAYHVSVLEPLSTEKRQQRDQERQLDASVQRAKDALALLDVERERREQLQRVLHRLVECEKDKEALLAQVAERRTTVQEDKSQLQTQINGVQAQLSALARELLDLDEQEQTVRQAWDSLAGEREDVEMTIGLSKNDQRLQSLAERLRNRVQRLEGERKLSSCS